MPSDVPDAPETRTDVAVATDYGTDHTWKLSPQRLVWALRKLGLVGEVDHYVSVFWWNQRKRSGGFFPSVTVTYGGAWADGDEAFLVIGGTTIGKSVFPADTVETIAAHFAYFINEVFVGVWAQASGGVLTITVRSPAPAYSFSFSESHNSTNGTVTVSGSLTGGVMGDWVIDDTATPVLNRAARDWHADYFAELAAHGMSCVAAFSQELVLPPDDPPTAVWVQRYPDGQPVQTATGFGGLYSSHCAFARPFRDYIQQAYEEIAALMEAASLTARLQFDEVLWWYFQNASGMAFYDPYTTSRFQNQ
ncbi:MAG: non-contractile tail sheath protein [Bryobacteraceae bacterium]